ncbi:hypothetical protein RRG08_065635 [Elysia crispata]|uniref:Uncharacterized protein n=1 Tax=Elysia crispata TaxID=231223 RepID=A0AAE1D2C8_9GAST|nr:hypothetical protein RRG08_065635 [Elysia crispata]
MLLLLLTLARPQTVRERYVDRSESWEMEKRGGEVEGGGTRLLLQPRELLRLLSQFYCGLSHHGPLVFQSFLTSIRFDRRCSDASMDQAETLAAPNLPGQDLFGAQLFCGSEKVPVDRSGYLEISWTLAVSQVVGLHHAGESLVVNSHLDKRPAVENRVINEVRAAGRASVRCGDPRSEMTSKMQDLSSLWIPEGDLGRSASHIGWWLNVRPVKLQERKLLPVSRPLHAPAPRAAAALTPGLTSPHRPGAPDKRHHSRPTVDWLGLKLGWPGL